jgi:guanyl-specific ribonuclease Sa
LNDSFVPRSLRSVLLLGVAILAAWGWLSRAPDAHDGAVLPGDARGSVEQPAARWSQDGLPGEALATLQAIERGGPFAYDRDGMVFQNRERHLPDRPRGYYREYTVETPGSHDRGARRIVSGGDPPEVFYYTDDHYRTFRQIEATR